MKTRIWILFVCLTLALSACNLPNAQSTATEDPNFVFTAAAQTVEAQLTQAAPQNTPTSLPQLPTATTGAPPTLPPTATSIPPTQPPTQECDKAQFIDDVTIEDGTEMDPNEAFVKTWRLKNTGTCSWTTSYAVVFSSGEQMSGPSAQALTGNVNPGQTVDISVNLKAPASNGTYKGYWKLRNAAGVTFSQFYVEIKVTGGGGGIFAVTSVTYSVGTWSDAGHTNCPRVTANITANGAGTVTFKWTRQDVPGGGSLQSLTFASAGTQSVNYDWSRGSVWAGTPTWVGVYVDDPNHQDFGKIDFSTACTSP